VLFLAIGWTLDRMGQTLTNVTLTWALISVSIVVPFALIMTGFRKRFRSDAQNLGRAFGFNYWFWRDGILSLAYSIVFGVAGLAAGVLVALAFRRFTYHPFMFAVWPALAAGAWAYFSMNLVKNFKPTDMVNLIGVFLIGGVYLSAVMNPNPKWWTESISYLGMGEYGSAGVLNLSLMLSGLLLLTLSSFIARRFEHMVRLEMISAMTGRFLKYSFIVAPIALVGVAVFPYADAFPEALLHNASAYVAFGLFGLVMLSTYWAMPFFSRYYMRVNYALLAVFGLMSAFSFLGYLTVALTEMVSFGVISVWLVLFLRSIDGILDWAHSGYAFGSVPE
jgi:hypothetical membrane protein